MDKIVENSNSGLDVNLEIGINGNSNKYNFQESGDVPGMVNINANAELSSDKPEGKVNVQITRDQVSKKQVKKVNRRRPQPHEPTSRHCILVGLLRGPPATAAPPITSS